jgi:hypothetical protein
LQPIKIPVNYGNWGNCKPAINIQGAAVLTYSGILFDKTSNNPPKKINCHNQTSMRNNDTRRQNCNAALAILMATSAVFMAVHLLRTAKKRKISSIVAEAGYETAYDIHFPLKINKTRKF